MNQVKSARCTGTARAGDGGGTAARREATARHDNNIGVEHLTLALVAMTGGAVPSILSALGASQAALPAAILDRHRRAS